MSSYENLHPCDLHFDYSRDRPNEEIWVQLPCTGAHNGGWQRRLVPVSNSINVAKCGKQQRLVMQLKAYMMERSPTKEVRHQTREFSIHSNMMGQIGE